MHFVDHDVDRGDSVFRGGCAELRFLGRLVETCSDSFSLLVYVSLCGFKVASNEFKGNLEEWSVED